MKERDREIEGRGGGVIGGREGEINKRVRKVTEGGEISYIEQEKRG